MLTDTNVESYQQFCHLQHICEINPENERGNFWLIECGLEFLASFWVYWLAKERVCRGHFNASCLHTKNLLLFLFHHPHMDDRAASTILISAGVDQVTSLERRENTFCPFFRGESFFYFLSSLCLHSSRNVSQPGREWGTEKERGRYSLLGERHWKHTWWHTSPIQSDELLKSKMTFCSNTLYSSRV